MYLENKASGPKMMVDDLPGTLTAALCKQHLSASNKTMLMYSPMAHCTSKCCVPTLLVDLH